MLPAPSEYVDLKSAGDVHCSLLPGEMWKQIQLDTCSMSGGKPQIWNWLLFELLPQTGASKK